jgi:hypothetical protein
MCALQFASALEINSINGDAAVKEATNRLTELHQLLVEKIQ